MIQGWGARGVSPSREIGVATGEMQKGEGNLGKFPQILVVIGILGHVSPFISTAIFPNFSRHHFYLLV